MGFTDEFCCNVCEPPGDAFGLTDDRRFVGEPEGLTDDRRRDCDGLPSFGFTDDLRRDDVAVPETPAFDACLLSLPITDDPFEPRRFIFLVLDIALGLTDDLRRL